MASNRSTLPVDFKYMPCFFCEKKSHFSIECRLGPANHVDEYWEDHEAHHDSDGYYEEDYEEYDVYENDEEYHEEDIEYDGNLDPCNFYIPCVFCGKLDHFSADCRLRPANANKNYDREEFKEVEEEEYHVDYDHGEYDGDVDYYNGYDEVFEYIPCFFCGKKEHFSTKCKLRPANADLDIDDEYENSDEVFHYIPCFFCGKGDHFSTECHLRPPSEDDHDDKDFEYEEQHAYIEEEVEDSKEIFALSALHVEHFVDEGVVSEGKVSATNLNEDVNSSADYSAKPFQHVHHKIQQPSLPANEHFLQLVVPEIQLGQKQQVHDILQLKDEIQQVIMLSLEQDHHVEVQPPIFQQIAVLQQQGQQTGHEQNLTQQILIHLQHLKNEIQHDMISDFQLLQECVTAKFQQNQQQLHLLLSLDFKHHDHYNFMNHITSYYFMLLFILCIELLKPAKFWFFGFKERG